MAAGSGLRALRWIVPATLMMLPGVSDAAVRVTFGDPAHFRDADRAGGIVSVPDTLNSLAAYLKRLGRRLPPGQDLDVQVLDVNLAGVSTQDVSPLPTTRVLSGATWPSMRLRYQLRQNGRVVRSNEELVADREYLARPNVSFDADPLRYEKSMLYDWFNARFVLGWAPPR